MADNEKQKSEVVQPLATSDATDAQHGDSDSVDGQHRQRTNVVPPSVRPKHVAFCEDSPKSISQMYVNEDFKQFVSELHAHDRVYSMVEPNSFDEQLKMFAPNLHILPPNPNVISLQTIIRDLNSSRESFVFTSDRLIRLVLEAGLNLLPYNEKVIVTPTSENYTGVEYHKSNCGVSIVRSGEAMEKALRDCCRSIRIGKVLIDTKDDNLPRTLYAKLPTDIALRKVLLLYPIMSTGNTVIQAIKELKRKGVKESNIILINLFTTPFAVSVVSSRFPNMLIQTSEVHPVAPHFFGQKYFGTD